MIGNVQSLLLLSTTTLGDLVANSDLFLLLNVAAFLVSTAACFVASTLHRFEGPLYLIKDSYLFHPGKSTVHNAWVCILDEDLTRVSRPMDMGSRYIASLKGDLVNHFVIDLLIPRPQPCHDPTGLDNIYCSGFAPGMGTAHSGIVGRHDEFA